MESVRRYCGDCGALLGSAGEQGCCVHADLATGQLVPAGLLPPLQWGDLEAEEQALVIGLLTFAETEVAEAELLERLDWTSELLHELVAPAGARAAEIACCVRVRERLRLTDHARDAFCAHLHAIGARIESAHQYGAEEGQADLTSVPGPRG
jgi:hypothetical protein